MANLEVLTLWWAAWSLLAGGFGTRAFMRHGFGRGPLLVWIAAIGAAGFWMWTGPHWAIDTGLLVFGGLLGVVWIKTRRGRWVATGLVFAGFAAVLRSLGPFGRHQAEVLPLLPMEALGLGGIIGIILGDPLGAAWVGGFAALASSLWVAGSTDPLRMGRQDNAWVLLSVLIAWTAGTGVERIKVFFRRLDAKKRLG